MRLDRASDSWNHELTGTLAFFHSEIEEFIEKRRDLFLRNRLVLRADLIGHVRDDLGLAHRSCHRVAFSSLEVISRCYLLGGRGHYSRTFRVTQVQMQENPQKIEVLADEIP